MKRILIPGLLIAGLVTACRPVIAHPIGALQTYDYQLPSGPSGDTGLTILMGGGSLNVAPAASPGTSVTIQTNIDAWAPVKITSVGATTLEQPNRPPSTVQPAPEVINDWQVAVGTDPLDIQIDARAWEGTLDFKGVDLRSFQLADAGSQGVIRFDRLTGPVSRLVIDSARSNLQVVGLLNTGAEEATITGAAGRYLLDFSGDLPRGMRVVVTTGLGVMRVEIDAAVNARVTYQGMTRKTTIQGDWISRDGAYLHPNPGYLLDLVIQSDQGDLEVALVDET